MQHLMHTNTHKLQAGSIKNIQYVTDIPKTALCEALTALYLAINKVREVMRVKWICVRGFGICKWTPPPPLSLYVGHSIRRSAFFFNLFNLSWTFVCHNVNLLTEFLTVLSNCKYQSISAEHDGVFFIMPGPPVPRIVQRAACICFL